MAIIYTYPRLSGQPESSDLVLITDVSDDNKSKNTTIQSINDLGPQGTVTDVDLTMPTGYVVDKTRTNGRIGFVVTGFPTELPADDPEDSVQFNKAGILTGVPGFTFEENAVLGENTLSLGQPINAGDTRGIINLYNKGRIALWADLGNQAVALTGPRSTAQSPSSYEISLPTDDPTLDHTPTPTLPAEARVWVVDGTDLGNRDFDSQFMRPRDVNGAVARDFDIQFRKPNTVDQDGNTVDNSGLFDASPQLSIVPIPGNATEITTGLRLSVGSMSRTDSLVAPQRAEVRIGSGNINQGSELYGGTLSLEYVYNGQGPVTGAPAVAYSHVTLAAPPYDPNIEIDPTTGQNLSIKYQDYDLVLPQLNPEYSDNNQPYEDDNNRNISKLLIVNPVDSTTNGTRVYESKFISLGNLGVGPDPGSIINTVQYKGADKKFAGSTEFQYFDNNQGTGAPNGKPQAHEIVLGGGGGTLPGMLTIFGDNDPIENGGTDGILRFVAPTNTDYATISGPDIQTEITLGLGGSGYETVDSSTIFPTFYQGQGNGLQVFAKVDANGKILAVSVANQGSGYSPGDVLQIVDPQGQGQGATITVIAVRDVNNPDDEQQIYDIKLPKYTPFNDKIWFGKGTGKNGELTTNDYFKIPLIAEQGHSPGGRLQLTIGSPSQSVNEPYGSILLNGGNNSDEGGIIRLASAVNNTVGIAGPQVSPTPVEDYTYDFSLPTKSPEQTDQVFNAGVSSANVSNAGSGYVTGGGRVATRNDAGTGQGCSVTIDTVGPNGEVGDITIIQQGEGYSEGDVLTILAGDELATLEVISISGYKNKVLVASEDKAFGPNSDKLYETRWVDPNDLGISGGSDLAIEDEGTSIAATASTINFTGGGVSAAVDPNDANKVNVTIPPTLSQGFSPFPIYQGNDGIIVNAGTTLTIACNTICDAAASQITVARVFGKIQVDCVIRVAVYSGELGAATATELIAYGETPASAQIDSLKYRINLNDMLPNPTTGLTPVWSPAAGTPIVVVIEIDNSNPNIASPSILLGSTAATMPNSGITGVFGSKLAFKISDSSSAFDSSNTQAGSAVDKLIGYNTEKEDTQIRVCHHFDPFAPTP